MFDIGVFAYQRALFFYNKVEMGKKGVFGQSPGTIPFKDAKEKLQ